MILLLIDGKDWSIAWFGGNHRSPDLDIKHLIGLL